MRGMTVRPRQNGRAARLLDLDPELADGLSDSDRTAATARLLAGVYELEPGPWTIREPATERGAYGLLVVDGLVALRTSIAERATLELVGPGDLLQPWVQLGAEIVVPAETGWRVIERSKLLLLDRAFAEAAADWPEITAALMYRLVLRNRRLCYQLAVNTSPRIEERLLYGLWALAARWGRVTEQGTVIKLRLTHEQLAELISAQRPSVSTALGKLREQGRIAYGRDEFILCGEMPGEVEALNKQVALSATTSAS
jgi:CRP/FNR family cyclic AMP-dependent transcriptional regulator